MSVNSKNVDLLEARIPIQSHGMRLDQVVAELFPDYSRNRLATWIKEGRLTVDGKTMNVKEGDIVFIERNKRHKITAAGNQQAIRLAVSRDDVDHIYE